MVISSVKYLGSLRTEASHIQSGKVIITDAPTDNEGRGEAFSPTDLLSTSLASCMFTLMGITASKHGIEFKMAEAKVEKEMLSNPRRVGLIRVLITMSDSHSDKERRLLETAALNCPVAQSLNPEIKQEVEFFYNNL